MPCTHGLSLGCNDDAEKRGYEKDDAKDDREVKDGLFHTTAGPVYRAVGPAEHPASATPPILHDRQADECDRRDDLNDIQIYSQGMILLHA